MLIARSQLEVSSVRKVISRGLQNREVVPPAPAEAEERARTAREAGPEPGALDEARAERVIAGGRLVCAQRLQDPPERSRGRLSRGAGAGGGGAAGGDPDAGKSAGGGERGSCYALEARWRPRRAGAPRG
jgi:hypothetical protein